ncbi:DNA cytosine methyltransferase [Streptomyces litmocidini]|uniref:DNA cytosine methyltransferase n=1 Tax=Streptomyces litmocidini TaxID=67318 RepID=UPI00167C7313|nr:DNA (cytosine-5-)-methyltransferase [Streptomyces litmocidini]GGU87727.1 DNA cytosine methyltransferase [Streptomyces litmocidini]
MGAASGRSAPQTTAPLTSVEICAGAGGQAVGLHNAGFHHLALIEWDSHAVDTLKANVSQWPGWEDGRAEQLKPMDVKELLKEEFLNGAKNLSERFGVKHRELDLLAGGVPCPPFSLAGKRLGAHDERDLFPTMLQLVENLRPKAVMIENVRGILEPPHVFIDYRRQIVNELFDLGYDVPFVSEKWSVAKQSEAMSHVWRRLDASDYGVPQLRPRAILVAIRKDIARENGEFVWPKHKKGERATVFKELEKTMLERCKAYWSLNVKGEAAGPGERTGKQVFEDWKKSAFGAEKGSTKGVAPTLVGGSRKHGGADLGPTRAKRAWEALGIDAMGVANDFGKSTTDPERDLFRPKGPMLTVKQAAIIQGFPPDWDFQGGKTARYRQVGNAFPPPVAEAVGRAIIAVLRPESRDEVSRTYELDSGDGAAGDVQLEIDEAVESVPAEPLSPRTHRSGDLVGARR